MKELIEFLNDNQGAFMVIITFVYVIATIIICSANIKSAKVTKEQLEESKRQFEASQKQAKAELEESKRQFDITKQQAEEQFNETKRQFQIVNRPRIIVEIKIIQNELWVLRFTNIGATPAYRLNICMEDSFINSIVGDHYREVITANNNREMILSAGQSYDLFYGQKKSPMPENELIKGVIDYIDNHGQMFHDEINLDANKYPIFAYTDSDIDMLKQSLKAQTGKLAAINQSLNNLSDSIKRLSDHYIEKKEEKDV